MVDEHRVPAPARLIALSFLGAIVVGTLLLALPQSHAADVDVDLIDALFTATSAVCVTGLVVVDTGAEFSRFGQVIILTLFQLGGLGLLTLGTILTIASGSRIGYADRLRVQEQVSAFDAGGVLDLVRRIVGLVAIFEIVGAVLLLPRFVGEEGFIDGAFGAVFHAVSAFNNAGFSVYSDSLTRFGDSWSVTLPVVALIITGGLGFVVLVDVGGRVRDHGHRALSLHSRMALSITGLLIAAGTVVFLILESGNPDTLAGRSLTDQLQTSLFQGVTPRTAGFNTVDFGQVQTPTLLFTMLLMFIGGNPGSTAGGIKTLTIFVLAVGLWSVVRQRREYAVFERRIAPGTILRAGVVTFGAVMLVGAALTLLTISDGDLPFLALLFETISAFGTVGLSMGITAELSTFGKLVIIFLMYLGRIGFLTFALALVTEHRAHQLHYPQEEVVIG